MRIIQLHHPESGRQLALVDEPDLILLSSYSSVYELAKDALTRSLSIPDLVKQNRTSLNIKYDDIYFGSSAWSILPAFDHPSDPMHCLVVGTGLTHRASAANRNAMHEANPENMTDSMRMYKLGEEGGKPDNKQIGVQPEWFYKGTGTILRAHNQSLEVPSFADDGGEEPEVAGAYIIDQDGIPCRIGFACGNEFSDHEMEKKNYLYLAPSKLRQCAIGPELSIDESFEDLAGRVAVRRGEKTIWSATISSGEKAMVHSIANMEYHHFKYPQHRLPGQAHVHFFGADDFSFGHSIKLADGDLMEVKWDGMGRALINKLAIAKSPEHPIYVKVLHY
ncbi:MAG: GguC protein [Saprospiraceae bacterium]|nr:GguC protein [Saprospiraceae bacterium]